MNFGSGTVPSRYGYSKTIPERCFRRGVGVRRPVPGAGARGCASARARPQRGFQRTEVGGSHRLPWRYMPHDLPPWEALYQQTQRWLKAGVFEEMVHDLRVLFLRLSEGLAPEPTAAILDSRAPCILLRRAALGAATTGPRARRAPRCTRRWTLWGICSPCM
jgi:hypothetical protein